MQGESCGASEEDNEEPSGVLPFLGSHCLFNWYTIGWSVYRFGSTGSLPPALLC